MDASFEGVVPRSEGCAANIRHRRLMKLTTSYMNITTQYRPLHEKFVGQMEKKKIIILRLIKQKK
jgi:hypothetical protein